jgi:dienelactone hydrolase
VRRREGAGRVVAARRPRAVRRSGAVGRSGGGGPYPIAERVLTFVDRTRRIHLPRGRREPRTLVTDVWYPEGARGPFPLVVFGHGFAVTPRPYEQLLKAWARAGYVVAAPIFPLENANAPGGPNEADLINQPRDMRFVITELLELGRGPHGFLAGAIEPRQIAVSGQSDGGETALAVAYDRRFRDRRVRAAVILSGAEIPGAGLHFAPSSPPLLATQGTADKINPPRFTYAFFDVAPRPKFLLRMFGARHLGPYTDQQPQLGIVERVTIAFFQRYLNGWPRAPARMIRAGDVGGTSALTADP